MSIYLINARNNLLFSFNSSDPGLMDSPNWTTECDSPADSEGYVSSPIRKYRRIQQADGYWKEAADEDFRPSRPKHKARRTIVRSPSCPPQTIVRGGQSSVAPVTVCDSPKSDILPLSRSNPKDIYHLLGVSNKVEYEMLLSKKLVLSLVKSSDDSEPRISDAVANIISDFLAVSIGTIYQPDLFYLTMPLLVQAVQSAGNVFKISSEPPFPEGRKRFGDTAIYEIFDPDDLKIRVLVELRTEQAPCALRSVLIAAHKAMNFNKAGPMMLVIAVYANTPVKIVEVELTDTGGLKINKVVEFALISVRPREVNRAEAAIFINSVSMWLQSIQGCKEM